jgi:hypothetical protein
MNEFASKFEKYFSMVSCLSTTTTPRNAWYVNSEVSFHMTSAQQLFSSLTEQDSGVQLELGDDAKYSVVGIGTIPFQLESGNSLDVNDVLFVFGLKKKLLSISVIEDKGFVVEFKNEKVLIMPKESIPKVTQVIMVSYKANLFEPWFIMVTTCVSWEQEDGAPAL